MSLDMIKTFPQDYLDKFVFNVVYHQPHSVYKYNFLLYYYPVDKTVGLYNQDLNRIILRRSSCPEFNIKDISIGNTVLVYGRELIITGYADKMTREIIGRFKKRTSTLIQPSLLNNLGEVLTQIEKRNFTIAQLRMLSFSRKEALEFFNDQKDDAHLPFLIEVVVSGPCIALELIGENAFERWNQEVGPIDPTEARKTHPNSLRAIYGNERSSNGFHSPNSIEASQKDVCYYFPQGLDNKPATAPLILQNSTCCVIKPHAIFEGKLGYIINEINHSVFQISAMQMFYLSEPDAKEFLEVYKGVVSNFYALLRSFLNGPCIAMQIVSRDSNVNVHSEFRKFSGPSNSDIARQIRPHTLRAKFGVDEYRNAVHCTDLPEDTVLEIEYFFKILN